MQLTGLHIPLITPFTDDGSIDLPALERLANAHLDSGADGLVALGTTGEPATLTDAERAALLDRVAGVCAERGATLTVGAGSNSTAATAHAVRSLDRRAAAALVTAPPFTRPSEPGVVAHFRAIAAASDVPVVVYDVPARTGRTLSLDTLLELAAIDSVVGFKHSIGAITDTTVQLIDQLPAGVSVLAGDDPLIGAILALGGDGAICASANVAAPAFVALVSAWRAGRVDEARARGGALAALSCALFAEPNPAVIKAVLAASGMIAIPAVRLPLLPASEAAARAAMALVP